MRPLPTALTVIPLLLVSLAGCLGSTSAPGEGPGATSADPDEATATLGTLPAANAADANPLPDGFSRQETVVAGVKVFRADRAGVCSGAANACYHSTFTANQASVLRASLTWTHESNDFDLHLYRDGVLVLSSAGPAPNTSEAFEATLSRGAYELVVVAFVATQDTFLLATHFDAPSPPEQTAACDAGPLVKVGLLSVKRSAC